MSSHRPVHFALLLPLYLPLHFVVQNGGCGMGGWVTAPAAFLYYNGTGLPTKTILEILPLPARSQGAD
jgi:hypothetical protein